MIPGTTATTITTTTIAATDAPTIVLICAGLEEVSVTSSVVVGNGVVVQAGRVGDGVGVMVPLQKLTVLVIVMVVAGCVL